MRRSARPASSKLRSTMVRELLALLNPFGVSRSPMLHEDPNTDDQIAARGRPRGAAAGPGIFAPVLGGAQPQGLHTAPAVRRPGAQDVPEDRLPGRRRRPQGLRRATRRPGPLEGAALLDRLLRRSPAAKRGVFIDLLEGAVTSAVESE